MGMAQQLDQRPGRGSAGRVMPREHHRDEHPGDLVRVVAQVPVGVADPRQHGEQVARLAPLAPAPLDGRAHELDEARPRAIALAEGGQRQVRVHVGEGVGAALEVLVRRGELRGELLAEFATEQAGARGVDRELSYNFV